MDEKNWLQLLSGQNQLKQVLNTNQYTDKFGLVLSEQEAQLLVANRQDSLREQRRVEFGEGILPKIIYNFCDSQYINQDGYAETLSKLQEIFYLFKNECMDKLTDDEILHFMKEQFEGVCYGDLDYLEGTCLEIFCQAIRSGYDGYLTSDGYGEYENFDEVPRWDKEVYLAVVKELFWG